MAKGGGNGGTPKTAKSNPKSDVEKSKKSQKSKKEMKPDKTQGSNGSKIEILEESNGAGDQLVLPEDYSARRTVKDDKIGDQKTALLSSIMAQSNNPSGLPGTSRRKSSSEQKSAKNGCCYSSTIENYRIPSIVIIVSLAIEACGYLILSTVLFYQSQRIIDAAAVCVGVASVLTAGCLVAELIRFISTYCKKTKMIETAAEWKWSLLLRIFLLLTHVVRLLFVFTALILILLWQDLHQKEIVIVMLAVFLTISVLPIFTLAWMKKK